MKKITIILLVLFTFLLAVASVSAAECGPNPDPNGCFVTVSTTLNSTTHFSNISSGAGFLNLNTSNVVLDCDGALLQGLDGNGTAISFGFSTSQVNNVTIKNCNMDSWAVALSSFGANNSIVENNSMTNLSFLGMAFFPPSEGEFDYTNITVRNNFITGTFSAEGGSDTFIVTNNTFVDTGMLLFNNTESNEFTFNTFFNSTMGFGAGSNTSQVHNNLLVANNIWRDGNIASFFGQNGLTTNLSIINNTFTNLSNSGGEMFQSLGGSGILMFQVNGSSQMINLLIQGNVFDSIDLSAVTIFGAIDATITDNFIENSNSVVLGGQDVSHSNIQVINADNVTISSNVLINNLGFGITIDNTTDVLISDTVFSSNCCELSPISIFDSGDVTITNITVGNITSAAILVDNSGNIIITDSTFNNPNSAVVDISGSTSLTVSNSTFDGAASGAASAFKSTFSPFEDNGITFSHMIYATIMFTDSTTVTTDNTIISPANGIRSFDLVLVKNFSNVGGLDTTLLIEEADLLLNITDCSSIAPVLEPGETCINVVDGALLPTGATSDYDTTNLDNAINATFKVAAGGTSPLTLEFSPVQLVLIQTDGTPIDFDMSNTLNTTGIVASLISTNFTVDVNITPDVGPSYTLVTGPSGITISNEFSSIEWVAPLSESGTLESNLILGNMFSSLNPSGLSVLNSPAKVSFFGVTTCLGFNLFRSSGFESTLDAVKLGGGIANQNNVGGTCTNSSLCTNIQCSGTTLSFDVTGFSSHGFDSDDFLIPEFHEWVMIFMLAGVGGMFVYQRKEDE